MAGLSAVTIATGGRGTNLVRREYQEYVRFGNTTRERQIKYNDDGKVVSGLNLDPPVSIVRTYRIVVADSAAATAQPLEHGPARQVSP